MTGPDHRVPRRETDGRLVVHADDDGTAYVGAFGFDAATGGPVEPGVLHRIDRAGGTYGIITSRARASQLQGRARRQSPSLSARSGVPVDA